MPTTFTLSPTWNLLLAITPNCSPLFRFPRLPDGVSQSERTPRHLDATVFTHSIGALVIGDKTYSYHLLLSTTGGTVHDSDMRDIVVLCHPHSDFSRDGVRHYSSADFGNKYHLPFGEA
jgi:hypothetical protein